MNKKVRFGVIGLSRIAKKAVIPVFQNSNYAELAMIGTLSPEKAAEYDCAVGSYENVLADASIDAVYISLPNSMHEEWSIKAAHAGKHIWCEKPAALNYEGAKRMIEAAMKNNVRLMEGFMYRYHPQHAKVREIIASGLIGEVMEIRARIAYPRPDLSNIRLKSDLGGGFYFDALVYPINAARMLYGAEPVSVQCEMKFDAETGVDVEDVATLTFADDRKAEISGAFTEDYRSTYEIIGTNGTIRMERAYAVPKDMTVRIFVDQKEKTIEYLIQPFDHFVPLAQAFCTEIASGKKTIDFEDELLRQARVVDAGWKSAHEHKTIKIATA